uniref:Uncharacterized protein n=1 Tax=Romanomermis culicivorax TaxID=13658 RepID=A0A915J9X1_ROMCU
MPPKIIPSALPAGMTIFATNGTIGFSVSYVEHLTYMSVIATIQRHKKCSTLPAGPLVLLWPAWSSCPF